MYKKKLSLSEFRKLIGQLIKEEIQNEYYLTEVDKRENLRNYVKDQIEFEGYDEYEDTPSSRNLETAIEVFKDEYGWMIQRVGMKKAFIEWLRGMPSILDIPTYYYDIKNLMYSLGYDEIKDMDDSDIDKLYYEELYNVFFD